MLRLGDEHMGVRQCRQLGQMGHAEHLLVLCQGLELLRNALGRPAGNAGIHLVKDQGVHCVLFRQDIFHREHNSRQLAAGGHLAQRL